MRMRCTDACTRYGDFLEIFLRDRHKQSIKIRDKIVIVFGMDGIWS